MLSGGGRTLENLAAAIGDGSLPADMVGVISSHPDAYGIERARKLGLRCDVVDFRGMSAEEYSAALTRAVDEHAPDVIALAGFIRLWRFPHRYAGKVLNIHPALLPAFGGHGFYGARVHRAVIDSGVRFSGCTVHFADLEYDTGPIVLQRVIPVLPEDTPETLADRVFQEECVAYPDALRLFAEGRLEIQGRRVIILPPRTPGEPEGMGT